MSNYFSEEEKSQKNTEKPLSDKNIFEKISLYYDIIKDKIIIYVLERWLVSFILLVLYLIRVVTTRGYACLSYCIGIHLLNSFIRKNMTLKVMIHFYHKKIMKNLNRFKGK